MQKDKYKNRVRCVEKLDKNSKNLKLNCLRIRKCQIHEKIHIKNEINKNIILVSDEAVTLNDSSQKKLFKSTHSI